MTNKEALGILGYAINMRNCDVAICMETVNEAYSQLAKSIDMLELLKGAIIKVDQPCLQGFEPKESGVEIDYTNLINFVKTKLDEEYIKTLTEWIIENIDKDTIKKWLEK